MSEQINKLVQANDPILNNLVDTENKLGDLNREMVNIVSDYQETNSIGQSEPSFFNFNNSFFLLTLLGLVMLAVALAFLKKELKQGGQKKSEVRPEPKPEKEVTLPPRIVYNEKQSSPAKEKKSTASTARKIKVVKLK